MTLRALFFKKNEVNKIIDKLIKRENTLVKYIFTNEKDVFPNTQ